MKKAVFITLISLLLTMSSLAETLVLPSVVHAPGANGSFWKTAIGIYNASDSVQTVTVKSISSAGEVPGGELQPGQFVSVDDLGALFNAGEGTFLAALTRSSSDILFTARTYSVTEGQPGQFSTLLPPIKPVLDHIKIAFSRLTGARKALFLYGNLRAYCTTSVPNILYAYYGTPGSLVRLSLPENTTACVIENIGLDGYPSGGEPSDYYYYAWASEGDNVSNCPTIIVAE